MDERISNKKVLERFCNMKYIESYLLKRKFRFIGKLIRMQNDRIPARFYQLSTVKGQ